MLKVMNSFIASVFLICCVFPVSVFAAEDIPPLVSGLIISEIKVNYDTTSPLDIDEFIELYNPTTKQVDTSTYALLYFNNLDARINVPTKRILLLDVGMVSPGQHLVLAEDTENISAAPDSLVVDLATSGLKNDGGRVQLVDTETNTVIDSVAWSNDSKVASNFTAETGQPVIEYCSDCGDDKVQSFGRTMEAQQRYTLFNAGWILSQPTPGAYSVQLPPANEEEIPPLDDSGPLPGSQPTTPGSLTCEGIVISELLPNPSGLDAANEFIELYNPTNDVISLAGCTLQTSNNSRQFALGTTIMQPGAYAVFKSSVTGLLLPNGSGGNAWLLTETDEVATAAYPGGMADDVSWSYIDGTWQASYAPTPGAPNIAMTALPCPAGQQRNVETNRCQSNVVTATAQLTPCGAGQERSPQTNRCRLVGSASTAALLVACKDGQERNPETNRCRMIIGPGSSLGSCPEGQERNPDTNRCRKIVAGNTLAAVADVPSGLRQSSPKWWLLLPVFLAVAGYAVYEWRQDIHLFAVSAVDKLTKKK